METFPDPPGGAHLRTIAMPRDANPSGDIFGGWTLSQMDLAGATFAVERAGGRVATVAIDAMKFLHPITVGDQVSCFCSWAGEGATSIKVKVENVDPHARRQGRRESHRGHLQLSGHNGGGSSSTAHRGGLNRAQRQGRVRHRRAHAGRVSAPSLTTPTDMGSGGRDPEADVQQNALRFRNRRTFLSVHWCPRPDVRL